MVAANAVDFAIDQVRQLLAIAGRGQQVGAEQLLVERTGHLGHEDRVVVVEERLVLGGEKRVHGMAGFVRQREHVVEHLRLVVHQDVRVGIVRAAAERAALLAQIGIPITPAAVQASLQRSAVVAAQRFERRDHHLHGLIPSAACLRAC